ncbi:MAG TPA: class F sortase [Streptosporangiaceae bacterium]|nr:class F sortase [Streptosporangiaceae bacterium]
MTGKVRRPGGAREPARRRSARHRRPLPGRWLAHPVRTALVACGVLAIALGAAGWAVVGRTIPPPHVDPAPHVLTPVGVPSAVPNTSAVRRVARPVRLVIPAIGVSTRLIRLGLTSVGTLQVPTTTSVAGWFIGSPRPGAIGSSIIAGHIDSTLGPGVFFRLRDMRRGERAYVVRANRTVAVFRVVAVRMYAKNHFPTARVYGPVPDAELRLITCGGLFDYATGSYLSNVVVYAVLVGSLAPGPVPEPTRAGLGHPRPARSGRPRFPVTRTALQES